MHKLHKLLGIKLAMLTAHHPQTNSQTEHVNQVLEGYLCTFTSQQQDDWDDLLPSGEFFYNNSKHFSTQQTSFMLDTGRHPCMGLSGELPLTYLPLDPFLIVYFYSSLSSLSILYSLTSSTSTGSISSDCDRCGHSHVM
jgi:hypothetical protein